MELRNFKYSATNLQGKEIKGKIEAVNRMVCMRFLQSRNLENIHLKEYKSIISRLDKITFGRLINTKDLVFFLKQLGSLLNAGVNLLQAIEILSLQQENRQHRKLYFELYQQVYNGLSFSKALAKRPKEFPKLLVQMIEIGEITGQLPKTVLNMAEHFEKQMKLNRQIKSTIRMPLIYLIVTLLITVGMLLFVFPSITALFESFGDAELPGITQFFIDAAAFLISYALLIFGGLGIVIFVIFMLNNYNQKVHYQFSILILRLPIFGKLIQMNNQILISNSLSQMLGNGINSLKALQTVEATIGNVVYKELMATTISYIEDGKPFSKSFQESPFIDPVMSKMINTGERTGDIPKLMNNLSAYYSGIAEIKVDQIRAAIQPILLIIVYFIVGMLILALMLPMLSLGTQI